MKRYNNKKTPTPASTHLTEMIPNHLHDALNEFLSNPQHNLAHDSIKQTAFLNLLQRGLEEGNDLPRLADYIDRALVLSAGSTTCSTWWSTPSSFNADLSKHQQTLQSLQAVIRAAHTVSHQTYGTLSDDTSIPIDERTDVSEQTSLLNGESSTTAELSKSKKTQKEGEERAARAKEHFSNYERSSVGYLRRSTGIQQLEEGFQQLISAAQCGHPDAITLLKLSATDSITVFNYTQLHGRIFIEKLKMIPQGETLYGEAQWMLFILYYAKRYQKQVYENHEIRFGELQQALTHLTASAESTPVNSFRLSFSLDFIQPDKDDIISVETNARRLLEKEVRGIDPFFDTFSMLKPILPQDSKSAGEHKRSESKPSQTYYPFRILSDNMLREIDRSTRSSMQFVDVHKNSADQFIIDIEREVVPHNDPQLIVFIDAKTGSEVARVVCDSQRFIFFGYDDSIQLTLSNFLPCIYYQLNQREGQLTLKTKMPSQQAEYVEIRAKQLVIEVESVISAKRLNVDAENIQNRSLLEAKNLHIQVTDTLVNEVTARIHATEQLRITGGSIWNAGSIEADKKGLISLNLLFVHGATSFAAVKNAIEEKQRPGGAVLKGDDMCVIACASMNFLSYVTVRQWSLMTLAEFNIGLTYAMNHNKCRLISVDCGIDVPNLPQLLDDMSDFRDLLKKGEYKNAFDSFKTDRAFINTASFARWVIRTFVPGLGKPVDLVWTIYMLLMSSYSSIKQARALYRKWKNSSEHIEGRDWYAFFATLSSTANQGVFAVTQGKSTLTELESIWANYNDPTNHQHPFSIVYPNEAAHMLMLDVAALFAPTQTDDALLKAKSGFHMTGSLLDRSMVSFGSAHAALALNISNLFFSSFQEGTVQAGVNISETGHDLSQVSAIAAFNHYTNVTSQETADVVYAGQVLWQTEHCEDRSTISAQHVTLSSHDTLVHEGKIIAEVAAFNGATVSLDHASVVHADTVQVEGTDLTHRGEIIAKEVNFISHATIEDAGQIAADEISLQANHQIKRLQSAVLKAEHVIIYAKEGEIVDHGKMSIHVSASVSPQSPTTEVSSSSKSALSEVAKSIILAADSEIEATHQAIVIQSTDDAVLAGKITAGSLQLQANAAIELQETGVVTADSFSAKASTITQNSHLIIHPIQHKSEAPASTPVTEGDVSATPKTILVDVDFNGTQSVYQGSSGNIEAAGAVIAMTSTNEVIDAGHMNAKQVLLRGDKTVERSSTASIEAEKIYIGTATSNTIDNGKLTLTVTTESTTDIEPSLDEQGQQVTLGETYQLTALEQTAFIHSESKLTVAGQLTAGEISLNTKEEMRLDASALITAHRMNATAKSITQNSHIIVDGVSHASQDPASPDKKNNVVADVSLDGSEQVSQGVSGNIEAKNAAVLFNSKNEIIDAGHIASSQVYLQGHQAVTRTKTALTEVSSMSIGTGTSQTVDQGKTVVTSPKSLNPSSASVLDSEKPIAVIVRGNNIVLDENHQLVANDAQVQIDSGSDLTIAGHITAQHVQFKASDKIDSQVSANVAAHVITMYADVVLQNGELTIDKPTDEPRTIINKEGKTIPVADMILEGSHQVVLGSTGRIDGANAVVQLTSPIEVIDAGEISVKHAYLEAKTRVERTQTANATAEYLQLGLNDHQTATLIDNGRFIQVPSQPSSTDVGSEENATSNLALLAQAKTIVLGETHQLTAPTGSSIFDASESLTVASSAHQTAKKVLYQAPAAAVKGFVEADLIDYRVDPTTSDQVNAMLNQSGDYQQWHPKTQLTIKSTQPIQLHSVYELPYSVDLTGAQFIIDGRVHSTQNLSFTAIAGDITLNHAAVTAGQQLLFDTSGNYPVTDSTVIGNETQILAKGNVINQHSTLQGQTYLNIEAGGNVENYCKETNYTDLENAHDTRIHYSPAVLSGGTGIGYEGIGLNIKAGGRFILDSSNVTSIGSNHILAQGQDSSHVVSPHGSGIVWRLVPRSIIHTDAAITMTARSHQYKITDRHDSNYGFDHDHDETDWDSQASVISSTGGNNVIQSQHGSIDVLATDISAPGQTSLSALGKDIILRALVLNHHDVRSSSNIITESSTDHYDEYGRLTRVVSLAGVYLYALNDVRLEGAQIQTAGKLEIDAGHDVIISTPILNHSARSDSITANVEFPICPPLNLVSVYEDFQALFNTPHSQSYSGGTPVASESNATTKAVNAWNLAIDSLNSFNGIMSGSLANAVFPASSMTVARVNFTHTETELNWQTTDPNAGIFCGSLKIHALNNIEFLGGIPAKIAGRADLEGGHVILQGGVLHSSSHTNREGISIGVTASGHPTVGASVSASNASATSYVNQEIDAEIVNINAKTLDIDSGNINAVEIGGTVETVNITSHCDTSESESKGLSGDSEGNFNYQQSSSHTKVINKVSGINATNSTLDIGEANLTGGRLTVTGNNQTKVGHMNTRTVEEEKQGNSFGLCGNLQDLGGTGNRSFASAIPTIGVNVGKGDYRAHQDSIFTGAAEQSGLDSSGGDGLHETHNTQFQQKVEIPLFNQEGSRQLEDDLIRLEAQFSTPSVPANPVPVESPKEPVVHHTKAHADTEHKQSAGEESSQTKTPTPSDHKEHRTTESVETTLSKVDAITKQPIALSPKSSSYAGGFFKQSETATQARDHASTSTHIPLSSPPMNDLMNKIEMSERGEERKSQGKWEKFWDDPIAKDAATIASMMPVGKVASTMLRVGESVGLAEKLTPLLEKVGIWNKTEKLERPEMSRGEEAKGSEVNVGEKVYRVWGDGAHPYGASWTRINPDTTTNYRDVDGLPKQNTGRFMSEGFLKSTEGITQRAAIPLHGNNGGLDEIVVPKPEEQITLGRVSGVNPPF